MLTIYKASAGSGKTFALAKEYIKLLIGEKTEDGGYRLRRGGREHHQAILAITFTNKATEEMKRRIVKELAVLAGRALPAAIKPDPGDCLDDTVAPPEQPGESPYKKELMALFGCSEEDLKKAADKALVELLHNFEFFNVSTIDSFFQLVLRTFAREAELTGNFELELDDKYAVTTAVDQMIKSINSINRNTDKDTLRLANWLEEYMMSLVNEGKKFNFLNRDSGTYENLIKTIGDLFDDTFKENHDAITEYLEDTDRLPKLIKELADQVNKERSQRRQAVETVYNVAAKHGINVEDRYIKILTTIKTWLEADKEPTPTVLKAAEDPTARYYKGVCESKKGSQPIITALDDAIVAAIKTGIEVDAKVNEIKCVSRYLYVLGILAPVVKFLKAFREENNLILLSDTNDILRRIISDDEVPFVYERLGMQLKHYLIDEFQDTSTLQWSNLTPLVKESESNNHDNLIIGDEKQSIYRFRGSDPELLRTKVQEQFEWVKIKGVDLADNTNWRSSRDVVEFNNQEFTKLAKALGLVDIYANVEQQVSEKHKNHRGYVSVTKLPGKDDEFKDNALARLVEDIVRLRKNGYQSRDIVILVDTNKEASTVVTHLLKELPGRTDIPKTEVLSDEALLINASPAVRLIVSMLRYIDTPGYDEQPAEKRSNYTEKEIAQFINRYEYLATVGGKSASDALLEAMQKNQELDESIDELTERKDASVVAIVESIIAKFLSEDDLKTQAAYIYAFQDLANDYMARYTSSLHDFLKWWDATGSKRAIPAPATSNAIRVMTIHKSKGLEFPCVLIPFANWSMSKSGELQWYKTDGFEKYVSRPELLPPITPISGSKALEATIFKEQYKAKKKEQNIDRLNVTYVAFTRAVDVLIVYYSETAQEGTIGKLLSTTIDGGSVEIGEIPQVERAEVEEVKTRPYMVSKNDCEVKSRLKVDEIADVDDIDDLYNLTDKRVRGTLLHNIMRTIETPNDLDRAILRQVSRAIISKELGEEFKQTLSEALSDERVAPWFEGYTMLLSERAISLGNGERRRPDRVVRMADGRIAVIDYKFGEHSEKYIDQVSDYVALIARQFPESEVKGYLWYPLTSTIIEVNKK